MIIEAWHPVLPFLFAFALNLILPSRTARIVQILMAGLSLFLLFHLRSPESQIATLPLLRGIQATFHLDPLSFLFASAFAVFGLLAHLYAFHSTYRSLHLASNLYIAGSIGAVLSGDLVTLFVFWEIMALSSCLLIWNPDRKNSASALLRYFLVHLTGGLFFFAGLILKLMAEGNLAVAGMPLDPSGFLIFIAFMINAAVFPVHAWLPDSYPEGTVPGSVYLSAFTTKVAVYAFARCFAGEGILIGLGAFTAVFGVVYALMENDMRRLLSYHIVCQIGYMIAGIGLGTELGINAGTGHAIGNILFKGLLFMATGVLIHMTGKYGLHEFGGLSKHAKGVLFFFMAGALAISGFPFLNGYVTKSLLTSGASEAHAYWLKWLLLFVASGTFASIALKLAYFAFWGRATAPKITAAVPLNMTLAMAGLFFLCLLFGLFPDLLYDFLPHEVHAHVYDAAHLFETLQLLAGTLLGFFLLQGILAVKPYRPLDTDWFYRCGALLFVRWLARPLAQLQAGIQKGWTQWISWTARGTSIWSDSQTWTPLRRPMALIVQGAAVTAILLAGFFLAGLQ